MDDKEGGKGCWTSVDSLTSKVKREVDGRPLVIQVKTTLDGLKKGTTSTVRSHSPS